MPRDRSDRLDAGTRHPNGDPGERLDRGIRHLELFEKLLFGFLSDAANTLDTSDLHVVGEFLEDVLADLAAGRGGFTDLENRLYALAGPKAGAR